jgi:hypothetical protein
MLRNDAVTETSQPISENLGHVLIIRVAPCLPLLHTKHILGKPNVPV